MAKRSQKIPKAPTRKYLSKKAREERQQRLLYVAAAILAALVIVILGIGLYQEMVAKPARPVAMVAGVPIRANQFRKMLAFQKIQLNNSISQLRAALARVDPNNKDQEPLAQYYQQQIQYYESQLDQAPEQTLQQMIDDELIRQEAKRVGIVVTDEQVQLAIEQDFGYDRNPPTPTPELITGTLPITATPEPGLTPMTEAEFQKAYAEMVQSWKEAVGFSEKEIREIYRMRLLRQELERYLADQVPTTALQVHARHILLNTKEDAEAALARLKAGEDFATVAKELSTDESTAEQGGDLGWFTLGQMDPDFEKVAFNTPVGQISEIVQSSFGFHIIKVEERDENRPLDPEILEQKKYGVLQRWLEERRSSDDVQRLEDVSAFE